MSSDENTIATEVLLERYRSVAGGLADRLESSVNLSIHELSSLEVDGLNADRRQTILLMIHGLGVSIRSMKLLVGASEMSARDCFGIARSICETTINVCLLALGDSSWVERARNHAVVRWHRDKSRTHQVLDKTVSVTSGEELPDDLRKELQPFLDQFTSKKGAEIPLWTDQSVDKRIGLLADVDREIGEALAVSKLLTFDYGSEVIHGTYYGVWYFWQGALGSAVDREKAHHLMAQHAIHCIGAIGFSVEALTLMLHKKFELSAPRDAYLEVREEILKFAKQTSND